MKKLLLTVSCLTLFSLPLMAGPGHDHATPGDSAGGPLSEIILTDAMIKNLGIKTVPANLQNIAPTLDLQANIDYLPEKQAFISTQAEGTVTKIAVKSGQKISKGQTLLVFQPRLVGNPSVTITAPISGFVTEQNVIIGQPITPDQVLLKIADVSEVIVHGKAFEDMAQSDLAVGQSVTVTTPSFPDEVFKGVIHSIDATLESGSRTRDVHAIVKNPDGKLLANMQARMGVETSGESAGLVVPQRAILGDMGNYFLYVQESDHFYRRDVVLGQKLGTLREIIEGVLPDEQVVTVGNYQLQFVTLPKEGETDEHGHDH